jgi:hypothetical protein
MDPQESSTRMLGRSTWMGVLLGATYGLALRWLANPGHGQLFGPMSITFLVLAPVGIGFATIFPTKTPSIWQALFVPWIGCAIATALTMVIGWEGSICVVLLSPLMLVGSSIGGAIAYGLRRARARDGVAAVLLVPLAAGPLEQRIEAPRDVRRVETSIAIDADAEQVWSQIESVPEIQPHEEPFALYRWMGFPRPLSAVLDRPGVGGVREARFEGGVLFLETVTEWEPGRRLAFTIDAQEHLIPPTILDEHVTIGGPYFDVLSGTYAIEQRPEGGVVLNLSSETRVSTTFNVYAGWWADRVMRSIQEHVLTIVKARSEGSAASGR